MRSPRAILFGQHTARAASRKAFTLCEVLATLLLITIVLPVVMRGVSIALTTSSHARYVAQAASLGEAKLMELVATGQWSLATVGGDFGSDFPQYRWSGQVFARDFGASEIVIQVAWTERSLEQTLRISTMAYDNGTTSGIMP